MHDPRIRTGRTFRTLLKALLKASEGEKVVIIAFSYEYAKDLCYQTHNLANNYCAQIDSNTIEIGNGHIKFLGPLKRQDVFNCRMIEIVILRDHFRGRE